MTLFSRGIVATNSNTNRSICFQVPVVFFRRLIIKRLLFSDMKNQVLSIILLTSVMIVWGSSYSVTKASLNAVPPIFFALLRMSLASILLLILVQLRYRKSKMPRPIPWMIICLMGLTGTCLYYTFFNMGLFNTTATNAVIIQSFIPVVTALLAFVFLKEPLYVKRLIGIGISIAGVLLIIFLAAPSGKARNPFLGNILILTSVFVWATYTILAKRLSNIDPLLVTAYSITAGTLLLVPVTFVELSGKPFPVIAGKTWLSLIYLGAISSAAGILIYNYSLRHLTASQASSFLNLMPVIGVIIAVVFLKESLTPWQVAGGVLVLIGVLISLKK
jgi:drug/metabolite transporter (DMT)-like permease